MSMIYYFGEFRLDEARQELSYVAESVAVEPQVWRVLCYLLRHRDRVVKKNELLEHCWAGALVSDAAMLRCLSKLRQALRDNSREPLYIKTFHRQGYRFVAPVTLSEKPLPLPLAAPVPSETIFQPLSQNGFIPKNGLIALTPPPHFPHIRTK